MKANYHKEKYYCQICSRQCQDKDGFKCHLNSKTHEKNMEQIAKQPELYINAYSGEFEKGFLDILRRLYESQWVSANKVYELYMQDKESVQLSMTRWESLSKFIQHIVKESKCRMNPSESDVFLQYIDNGFLDAHKDKRINRDFKAERLNKEMGEISKHKSVPQKKKDYAEVNIEDMKGIEIDLKKSKVSSYLNNKRERDSSLMIEGKKGNEKKESDDEEEVWIRKGLIVCIEDKELEKGRFYKKRGKIITTKEYLAEVEFVEGNKKVKIDQYYLSNVIPSVESTVYVIKGKHKETKGEVKAIDKEKEIATIRIKGTHEKINIPLSQLCKYKADKDRLN